MENKFQKMQSLFRERESSYERQIASLKEEAITAQRRVQVASIADFGCRSPPAHLGNFPKVVRALQELRSHQAEAELLENDLAAHPSVVILR